MRRLFTLVLSSLALPASAEVVFSEADFQMGESHSRSDAIQLAKEKALGKLKDKLGLFVKTNRIINDEEYREVINIISAGIVKTEVIESEINYPDVYVKIKTDIDQGLIDKLVSDQLESTKLLKQLRSTNDALIEARKEKVAAKEEKMANSDSLNLPKHELSDHATSQRIMDQLESIRNSIIEGEFVYEPKGWKTFANYENQAGKTFIYNVRGVNENVLRALDSYSLKVNGENVVTVHLLNHQVLGICEAETGGLWLEAERLAICVKKPR